MSLIKSLLLLSLLLFGAWSAAAQEVCNRQTELQGGFSYCMPDGWTAEARDGEKYKIAFAQAVEHFRPNINMKDDVSERALEEYVTANIEYVLNNYAQFGATNVRALNRGSFSTTTGLAGIRATFQSEYKSLLVRTIQYYFNGNPGQKLLLTCTSLEANQQAIDPVCDRAAKTLQLEEKTNPPEED